MILTILICVITISVILFKIANKDIFHDETEKAYSNPENSSQKTILDLKFQLTNKTIQLSKELDKLKEEQKKIIDQFTNSIYMEQINTSSKRSVVNAEMYGVDVHCDCCNKTYSIKERRCPNCKAENPYWGNISDFE